MKARRTRPAPERGRRPIPRGRAGWPGQRARGRLAGLRAKGRLRQSPGSLARTARRPRRPPARAKQRVSARRCWPGSLGQRRVPAPGPAPRSRRFAGERRGAGCRYAQSCFGTLSAEPRTDVSPKQHRGQNFSKKSQRI